MQGTLLTTVQSSASLTLMHLNDEHGDPEPILETHDNQVPLSSQVVRHQHNKVERRI